MLIPDKRIYGEVGRFIGNDELVSEFTPDTGEVVRAALATENVLGSLIVKEWGLPDGFVSNEDFSPLDLMTEAEKDDPRFSDTAMLADSEEELAAFRRQYTKETQNRQILKDAGAMGAVAIFGAAVADPINLIPVGGMAYKTYKTGGSILSGAMATASVATGTAAATEAGLHATQLQRTFEESAINMSAAFLLGGALGAGVSHLSNRKLLAEIEDTMNVEPKIAAGQRSIVDMDGRPLSNEEVDAILREAGTDSVGAMSALGDVRITGKVARGLAKILGWDPLSRTLSSKNPFTRRLSVKLAENPYMMDGENATAVESVIKVKTSEFYNNSFEPHLKAYKGYRKDGGKLKRRDFNELVSKEQRNPGTVDNPFVKKSAQAWEANTYAPLKTESINAELLPADITRETAAQYLNRQWNPEKITAKFDVFVQKMTAHLKQQAVAGKALGEEEAADLVSAFEEFQFEDLARQIGQRLRTIRDGMLPYDYAIGDEIKGMKGLSAGVKKTLSGAFKDISLNVRDADFEDFLENDIELLARNYIRRVVPDIEFHKSFDGQLDMAADQKAINDWYDDQMLGAKTESERLKLGKQNKKDIRDVKAMNERIRGIYQGGSTIVDPESMIGRIMKVSRDLNYMRFLGGVVPASLSDVARITMAEGLTKTFTNGLIPMIRHIKSFKVAAAEAKRWGIGDEMISGNRVDVLADISDYSRGATAFERTVHSFAQGFSNINMINQWNAGVKQLQSVVMQNEIVPNMVKNKVDKRLVRLGISNENQIQMGRELRKHGQEVDGFWLANVGKWDNPELGLLYKTAMRKESDRVIVVPGQERPLFMSTELGKSLLQFRSFMMAATQRVLISAVQGQDANLMSSLLMMTSFGMMTYAFKQWDAGRPLSDDPAVWIAEGIDRSGATGIIMEISNTIEKLSSNSIGIRPLLGITTPSSRFASRDAAEAMLGPTFGSLLSTTIRVAGSATADYEWNDSDTRALRRLLPYQNLSIIRQGIDALEAQL